MNMIPWAFTSSAEGADLFLRRAGADPFHQGAGPFQGAREADLRVQGAGRWAAEGAVHHRAEERRLRPNPSNRRNLLMTSLADSPASGCRIR